MTKYRIQNIGKCIASIFHSSEKRKKLLNAETAKILQSIAEISDKNPELNAFLNEIPQSSSDNSELNISNVDLKKYNESLRQLLKKFRLERKWNQ